MSASQSRLGYHELCTHLLEFRQSSCHKPIPSPLPETEASIVNTWCNSVPTFDTGVSQSVVPQLIVSNTVELYLLSVLIYLVEKMDSCFICIPPCNQWKHLTRAVLTLKKCSFQKFILHDVF